MKNWDKWDGRFIDLASHIATWSKDPSTKVGAVIVDPETLRVMSMGFNGFPRGVVDTEARLNERSLKYALIAHAERNALDLVNESVRGFYLYSTLAPCSECTKSIIQRGIIRVVSVRPTPDQEERWKDSINLSKGMMNEAGLGWRFV